MKYPAQAHVLNVWFPDDDAILGGGRNLKKMGLEKVGHWA
jgi:hypothetical protein